MLEAFSYIDWTVITVYMVGLIGLGFYLSKKASANMQEYFLGGNKIPWWALGVSGFASQMDMTGTMIIVSLLFALGLRGMYVEIRGGLILLMAFAMVYHGKWNRRSGCMTVAEWMEYRFGSGFPGKAARMLQAISVILMTVGSLALFFKGSGMFLSLFLPWSPFKCAIGLFAVATIYTIASGFYGVVFTDIFQALFIVIAVIAVSVMAYGQIADEHSLGILAEKVTGNSDWLSTSIPAKVEMPEEYSIFERFSFAIFFYLLLTYLFGMSRSGGRPMYFGARNERECGTLSFVWILTSSFRWLLMAGFAVLGLIYVQGNYSDMSAVQQACAYIKEAIPDISEHQWNNVISAIIHKPENFSSELVANLQSLFGEDWKQRLQMVSYYGTVNSEQILPAVILYVVPAGLKGIIFVSLIAAAMSTFDTYVNQSAAYFVRDIYQRYINPGASEKKLVYASYFASFFLVLGGVLLGFYAKSINEIWDWIMVGIGGGMVLPGFLRWYWWRLNGIGYAAGVFTGMMAAILQRFITIMGFFPEWKLTAPWVRLPLILCISLLGVLIGTYFTKPTPDEVLENFYRTTRPFGFWKPLFKKLPDSIKINMKKEHKNDLISVFIAVPWQFLLYWIPVQIVFHRFSNLLISGVIFSLLSLGLYHFWYKNLKLAVEE
jgi:solute:Na+ symporter, SSS family